MLQGRRCVTNHLIKLSKQLTASVLPVELSRFLLSRGQMPSVYQTPPPPPALRQTSQQREREKDEAERSTVFILRWMALSRGMSVGLLGGEELVLWRLLRLSMDGDAWTVILCWKSAKGGIGAHELRAGTPVTDDWRGARHARGPHPTGG